MTYEVLITDERSPNYDQNKFYFESIDRWAQIHCPTYIGYHVQDVSDVSLQWDEIGCFQFNDEKDQMFFTMKWAR